MGLILLWLLHAAVSTLQPQIKNTPKKLHAYPGRLLELLNKPAPFYYIIFYTENNQWKIQEVVHGYISMPRTIYTVCDSLSKQVGRRGPN